MANCYICGEKAVAACASCYKPICEIHTIDSHTFDVPNRKCPKCASRTRSLKGIWAAIVGIAVIAVFIFVLSDMDW